MMRIPGKLNKWWDYFKFLCNHRFHLEPGCHAPLVELLSQIRLHRAEGIKKKRVGVSRDGGYVMLDDFAPVKGAYSLGIGHDVSWDLEIAEMGIPVLQFDYSIDQPPQNHALFSFHQIRIGAMDDPADRVESLSSLVTKHNPGDSDLILKVDIEGDEWEVFANIDPERLLPFRQIVVEFHHFRYIVDEAWRKQALRAITNLTQHHLPVHVHGNSIAYLLISNEVQIPDTLELTFARRNAYKLVPTDETFPGPCDKSNSLILRDVKLGKFQFSAVPKN